MSRARPPVPSPVGTPLPRSLGRRAWMLAGLGGAGASWAAGVARPTAPAKKTEPAALSWPRDHGSHPQSRIEWWYITGHARTGAGEGARDLGFQITFFRNRVEQAQGMGSQFAPRQLLFAHAAVSDVQGQRFRHDQRLARAGFGVAEASETDTAIRLREWSLERRDGRYLARVQARDFALELAFTPTQSVLLQGEQGLSRKGPDPRDASHYYSQPQMAFEGTITLDGQRLPVRGEGGRAPFDPKQAGGAAWLDHEWSDRFLPAQAVGWDWVGINLFDGGALTAFRLRDAAGDTLWDGGSFRHPAMNDGQKPYVFSRREAQFQALRGWTSPMTKAHYPVEWLLRTPADNYVLRALQDNQELDSRGSTGTVYWEGLCDLFDSNRHHVGRGYLEMTGYARPLVL